MGKRIQILAIYLLLVVITALAGGQFNGGEWYASLYKPAWNPPAWAFALVWPVLYLAMAVAAWQITLAQDPRRRVALAWWGVQLVLNGLWSWVFFGLHRPGWALAELSLLLLAAGMTWWHFRRIRPSAGHLLLPYLGWLGFAWLLNLVLWRMNGGGLATLVGG